MMRAWIGLLVFALMGAQPGEVRIRWGNWTPPKKSPPLQTVQRIGLAGGVQ